MSGAGRISVELGSLAVTWELPALAGLTGAEAPESPWRLGGELDADVATLRVLSIAGEDGTLLALAALRPRGAAGHGEETLRALLVRDGVATELSSALLSAEHGPDGLTRRVGLELYEGEDSIPLRVTGDATAARVGERGGDHLETVALATRLDGRGGVGLLETLRHDVDFP